MLSFKILSYFSKATLSFDHWYIVINQTTNPFIKIEMMKITYLLEEYNMSFSIETSGLIPITIIGQYTDPYKPKS